VFNATTRGSSLSKPRHDPTTFKATRRGLSLSKPRHSKVSTSSTDTDVWSRTAFKSDHTGVELSKPCHFKVSTSSTAVREPLYVTEGGLDKLDRRVVTRGIQRHHTRVEPVETPPAEEVPPAKG
jgi:hypothetical protein